LSKILPDFWALFGIMLKLMGQLDTTIYHFRFCSFWL